MAEFERQTGDLEEKELGYEEKMALLEEDGRESYEEDSPRHMSIKNEKIKKNAQKGVSFFKTLGYSPKPSSPSYIERHVSSSGARMAIYIAIIVVSILVIVFKLAIWPRIFG